MLGPSDCVVTLMLADAAQVSEGKLHPRRGLEHHRPSRPLGDRDHRRGPVGPDQPELEWRLELVDSDGYPVMTGDGEGGEHPIMMGGEFEVGRPPGTPHGAPIGLPLALNLAPLPLAPASRYEWRFTIDGESPRGLAPGLQRRLRRRCGSTGSWWTG